MSSHASKLTRIALAAAIGLTGAVAGTALTTATATVAQAASAVDGSITRSEVIARADYWYQNRAGIPYTTSGETYPDSSGRNYRKDCSGYVSMAWHLGYSRTTQTLPEIATEIPRSELKPGDILDYEAKHVILFEKWDDAAKTTFSYYSFGSTPVKHYTGVSINAATFDGHANGLYTAYRYNKIVDGGKNAGTESGEAGRARWADWDGDGVSDYLVVQDGGAVQVYLNRGGDGHGGWGESYQVASGMTADRSRVRFADWDGDGRADYLLVNGDGSVTVFPNRGGDGHGGWGASFKAASGMTVDQSKVRFADWNGDGRADYMVFSDSGALQVFINNGGDGHGGWGESYQVASGLTADRSRVRLADLNGDAKADYVVINGDGSVQAYVNNGGDGHGGWGRSGQVASGLTAEAWRVNFAQVNQDASADYLVSNNDGSTTAYLWAGGDGNGGWTPWGTIAAGA
ncbi:FG-GAP-like repeat-containing protein [Kitasatospora sp. NPDC096147]|uniref:C40 family peptidase n=1 Tax=Kitasatospora sp. NPDC096147 TaxID=3364093 RepID=UPI00382FF64A